jgi:hypothetical protein
VQGTAKIKMNEAEHKEILENLILDLMDRNLRDLGFNKQNYLVLPCYSPVDISVLPQNSLIYMSCMCTSSAVL